MTLLSAKYEITFSAEWITDPVKTTLAFKDKNDDGDLEETTILSTNEVPHRYHYYSRRDLGDSKEEPLARPNPAGEGGSRRDLGDSKEEPLARPNPAEWGDSFGMQWDLPDPLIPDYSDDNRYEYNGKEYERVAQLLDYGWRWYDPVIGRWNGVDPLASEFPFQSPFLYAYNNPILMVDIDGLYGDEAEAIKQRDFAMDHGLNVGEIYQSGDEWGFAIIDDDNSYHAFDKNFYDPMRGVHSDFNNETTKLGLSFAGMTIATMSETINYTARMQNPTNPGSVYGSGGKFAKGMFNTFGYGLAGLSTYDNINKMGTGEYSITRGSIEAAVSIGSGFTIAGASFGLGWEAGRGITNTSWYQEWKHETWLPYRLENWGY